MDTRHWHSAIPLRVLRIAENLRTNGHRAWVVGGAVRDLILNRTPKDFDLVTDASPERVAAIFPRTVAVGAHFGVMIVVEDGQSTEVATFRRDGKYLDSRHPEGVEFAGPEEDAARRDFTMNGLFWDPQTGEIHDYVDGLKDIAERRIRTIGRPSVRFQEDALRPLRALRFLSDLHEYGFTCDEKLLMGIRRQGHLILEISKERITAEIRLILASKKPSAAIQKMRETRMLERVFPQLRGVANEDFEHLLFVVDHVQAAWEATLHANTPAQEPLQLAALIRFFTDQTDSLKRFPSLKIARDTLRSVRRILSHRHFVATAHQVPIHRLKEFLMMDEFFATMALYLAECRLIPDSNFQMILAKRSEFLAKGSLNPKPLIDGNDILELGIEPGPRFRELLELTRREQLEEKIHTREQALKFLRDQSAQ